MEIRTDEDGIKFRVPYSDGWLKISSAMIAGRDALVVELPQSLDLYEHTYVGSDSKLYVAALHADEIRQGFLKLWRADKLVAEIDGRAGESQK